MYDSIAESGLSEKLIDILHAEGIYKDEELVHYYFYYNKALKSFSGLTPKMWKEVKDYYKVIAPMYDWITNPSLYSLRQRAFCIKFTNMLSKMHGSCEGLTNQIKRMQETDLWEIKAFISAIDLVKYNTDNMTRYLSGHQIESDMDFNKDAPKDHSNIKVEKYNE
jgi:hypothetical protein